MIHFRPLKSFVCLAMALLIGVSSGFGQESKFEATAQTQNKELIQVYRLQNIDSKSAVDIASTVMADQLKRIALDTRSNSIIVQAN
ncbi:MAG: hypothetical protein AAF802_24575, partial [Planctomycetota bacterium]